MFPEISIENNSNSNPNQVDIIDKPMYTDLATSSIDLSSNQSIVNLFEMVEKLWDELVYLVPNDIKGNVFDKNSKNKEINIFNTIKYSGLEDLDVVRNNLIQHFNSKKQNDILFNIVDWMRNFNPKIIPEFKNNNVYIETNTISNLIEKFKNPVSNSDDIIIYCQINYPEKKNWILKTIVTPFSVKSGTLIFYIKNKFILLDLK